MSISKDATSTKATKESSPKSSVKGRTSKYIGVNKSRGKDGTYVASVHDKEIGYTVYLGTFGDEEEAARAHDIASFKCSGHRSRYNFPLSEYEEIVKLMENMTKQQVLATIKRCGVRFAGTADSNYRGVARTPENGRWTAQKGVRDGVIYLGSFVTPEEAAIVYDVEAIKIKGWNAITNFDIKLYNVEAILAESVNPSIAEDRAKFVKKELLDTPKKYAKGKGKQFLEEIGHKLRCETTGPGETSNSISSQPVNFGENQLSDPTKVEEGGIQIEMLVEQSLMELPPYHFAAGAGNKFRHSSSSCFKPYKRPELG